MCGRFTLHTEKDMLATRFAVDLACIEELEPHYNIAPTDPVVTVRETTNARCAEVMRWGLIPFWAKDRKKLPLMINARYESVASKPAYREAFRRRRCLILADGFYEWRPPTGLSPHKTPYWISLGSREPFAMAGLWEEWRPKDGGGLLPEPPVRSCTILTIPAAKSLSEIHDRMPAILAPEHEAAWLDPEQNEPEVLHKLLSPPADTAWAAHPVSRRVNSSRSEGAHLIEPYDEPSLGF